MLHLQDGQERLFIARFGKDAEQVPTKGTLRRDLQDCLTLPAPDHIGPYQLARYATIPWGKGI
ncbi:MAG: hypothetical protein WBO17_11250 [Sphingorhabdus sp.]